MGGNPATLVAQISASLRLTYRIRYHALDRKVRKIVKNKYRYVRSYVCIRETQRFRLGLRLMLVGALLQTDRRWGARVYGLLADLQRAPQACYLRHLRRQHHQTALQALGLL